MAKRDEVLASESTQGYKQFMTARKRMLDAYDLAKEQSSGHEVRVYHGIVAEAEFRNWLTDFLPKRYGVTSGYIVSQGLKANVKLPHYDVIIYDQLESPILWLEDNTDRSSQGNSRAIPAEYVRGVIEVKSSFEPDTVRSAVEHLKDLEPLLVNTDLASERYKKFLRHDFFSTVVFYELRRQHEYQRIALNNFAPALSLRRFFGGLILRGEGISPDSCGQMNVLMSDQPYELSDRMRERSLLSGHSESDGVIGPDGVQLRLILFWTDFMFARFAFDLVALLNGTYDSRFLSSFHGFRLDSSVLPK